MKKVLSFLRTEYFGEALDTQTAPADPMALFANWFELAQKDLPKTANACTLCTVNAEGQPSSRVVLMKEFNAEGIVFFTHYPSRKGQNLEVNPKCALSFFWDSRFRQVHFEGLAKKLTPAENQAYWQTRPRESQISALASHQSKAIVSREALEDQCKAIELEYKGREIPCPAEWGGYLIEINRVEFWQGRLSRLHDRLEYVKGNEEWAQQRLQP